MYKGSLQGRAVAVKRLLQDFVTLASREVNVLQESDDHPNVIRYYYQESRGNFLYIALALCPASLADIIEHPDEYPEIVGAFDPKRALRQVTAGLRHLHALKIIHRDIKPQNILVSHAKHGAGHRMLISDFGLCKKLDLDQTSFLPTAHGTIAAGTVGWRAPEILRGEVKLDESTSDDSQSGSSRGYVGTPRVGTPTGKPTRLTKSVDIFALGCLYYYVLTNGGHPFGDRFEREANIMKNAKSLDGLQCFGEEGAEGVDLINRMLSQEAYDRYVRCSRSDAHAYMRILQAGYHFMSAPSILLGSRQTVGVPGRGFRPIRDNVSRSSRRELDHTRNRRIPGGWERLVFSIRPVIHRELRQVQKI